MYHNKLLLFLLVVFVAFILYATFKKSPEMMTENEIDIPLPEVPKTNTESLKSLLQKHLEDHKKFEKSTASIVEPKKESMQIVEVVNEPMKIVEVVNEPKEIVNTNTKKQAIPEPVKVVKNSKTNVLQENVITHQTSTNMINEPMKIVSVSQNSDNSKANAYVINSLA